MAAISQGTCSPALNGGRQQAPKRRRQAAAGPETPLPPAAEQALDRRHTSSRSPGGRAAGDISMTAQTKRVAGQKQGSGGHFFTPTEAPNGAVRDGTGQPSPPERCLARVSEPQQPPNVSAQPPSGMPPPRSPLARLPTGRATLPAPRPPEAGLAPRGQGRPRRRRP